MSDSPVSRRAVLLAGAGLGAAGLGAGLGGCEATSGQPATHTAAAVDPFTPVLIGQQELLATYERSITAFPDLTAAVSDLQAQTSAHTEALRAAAPAAAAQVSASASPSAPPSQSGSSPEPPADVVAARSDLRSAVQAAAGTLRAAALRADGDVAALLGSCAASTACHVRLLE